MEGSLTGLRTELHEDLLEKQEQLRKELRHELPEDGLSATAPPFVPQAVLEDDTTQPAG